MPFDRVKRRKIKAASKARVLEQLGACVRAKLLVVLPSLLLMILMMGLLFQDLFLVVLNAFRTGTPLTDEALAQALATSSGSSALPPLLVILVTGPLQYGMMKLFVQLQRSAEPRGSVLDGLASMRSIWAGIRMSTCLYVRRIVWNFVPSLFFSLGIALIVIATTQGLLAKPYAPYATGIVLLLYLLLLVPISIRLLSYEGGWSFLISNHSFRAWDATRESAEVFHGNYSALFLFVLSFSGWYVLYLLTMGVCMGFALFTSILFEGTLGLILLGTGVVATLCIGLVFSAFLTAYFRVSFFAMFATLRRQKRQAQATPSFNHHFRPL